MYINGVCFYWIPIDMKYIQTHTHLLPGRMGPGRGRRKGKETDVMVLYTTSSLKPRKAGEFS